MAKEKVVYCFCRKGKNGNGDGFMVACDWCNVWFHGQCVGESQDSVGELYYCFTCRKIFKRCNNPECCNSILRKDSKYCSDKCGLEVNRKRYEKFFKPRWAQLEEKHSAGRFIRLSRISTLEKEKDEVIQLIGKLKRENEDLIKNIATIKEQAKELHKSSVSEVEQDDDDSDGGREDQEESTTSDQTRVFCLICGIAQPGEKIFKHWASCHRKQESAFNFTSDVPIRYSCKDVDEDPHLYCQKQDKKTKRYCMNIQSSCPQHSNWQIDNDEICACPLNVTQDVIPNGNYCLELKRDCRLHYNWDKFRLAAKNMDRIQAFNRLESLCERINRAQIALNETYGGVLGVMKHITHDHQSNNDDNHTSDVEMVGI